MRFFTSYATPRPASVVRLNEERRRREEEERLRWMRETEERRRLVQQHMVNLKRQRALEAERGRMAREEALTLLLMQEEKRCARLRVGGSYPIFEHTFAWNSIARAFRNIEPVKFPSTGPFARRQATMNAYRFLLLRKTCFPRPKKTSKTICWRLPKTQLSGGNYLLVTFSNYSRVALRSHWPRENNANSHNRGNGPIGKRRTLHPRDNHTCPAPPIRTKKMPTYVCADSFKWAKLKKPPRQKNDACENSKPQQPKRLPRRSNASSTPRPLLWLSKTSDPRRSKRKSGQQRRRCESERPIYGICIRRSCPCGGRKRRICHRRVFPWGKGRGRRVERGIEEGRGGLVLTRRKFGAGPASRVHDSLRRGRGRGSCHTRGRCLMASTRSTLAWGGCRGNTWRFSTCLTSPSGICTTR